MRLVNENSWIVQSAYVVVALYHPHIIFFYFYLIFCPLLEQLVAKIKQLTSRRWRLNILKGWTESAVISSVSVYYTAKYTWIYVAYISLYFFFPQWSRCPLNHIYSVVKQVTVLPYWLNFTSLLKLAASALKHISFLKSVGYCYLAALLFKNASPLQFLLAPAW